MTEAWVQSLFDDEPEVYGPKPAKPPNPVTLGKSRDGYNRVRADVRLSSLSLSSGSMNPNGAPPLDWWNVSEEEVRRRLILAMCPERVCRICGEPSRRIVKGTRYVAGEIVTTDFVTAKGDDRLNRHGRKESKARPGSNGQNTFTDYVTLGWTDCGHDDWRPGVVLDPFAGDERRPPS